MTRKEEKMIKRVRHILDNYNFVRASAILQLIYPGKATGFTPRVLRRHAADAMVAYLDSDPGEKDIQCAYLFTVYRVVDHIYLSLNIDEIRTNNPGQISHYTRDVLLDELLDGNETTKERNNLERCEYLSGEQEDYLMKEYNP